MSDRERQILHNLTYIWNPKKQNKKNENRNIDTKYNGTVLKCQSGGGVGGLETGDRDW